MTTETTKPDTLPLIRAQDKLADAKRLVQAIYLVGEGLHGDLEKSAIVELADTALRRIEKVDRRLQAYRDRVNGGAA